MKRIPTLILLAALPCALAAAPPPSSPSGLQPAPDGSRFLFVVDTSQAMRSIAEASRQSVFEMIFTGLGGQMRTGDTFGLWTFNEDVQAGEFPMQVWDAENPMEAASRAALFLHDRKCAGAARMDALALSLRGVIRAAVDVNIFVLSAGEAPFEGTPFDESISAEYDMRGKERRRLKKPFVTTLVARGGRFTTAHVAIAGQPLPLPERPAPVKPLAKTAAPTLPVVHTGTTNALVRRTAVPTVQSNAAPILDSAIAATSGPAAAAAEMPASPPAALEIQSPPPATAEAPAASRPKVMQIITRTNATPPKPAAIENVGVPSTSTNPLASAAKIDQPRPPDLLALPEAPEPAVPQPRGDVLTAALPSPLPVAARETTADVAPPPAVAAAPPTPAGLSAGVLLTMGGVLLAAVLFLLVVVLRRLRAEPRPSFITQSMERR